MKSSASSPSPGRIAVQPQPLVWMSRISIASVSPGSAPSTKTGPGQRVHAVPVEPRDHARVGVGPDLVVGHVAGLEHDGVAVGDRQHRLVARVPREVDAVQSGSSASAMPRPYTRGRSRFGPGPCEPAQACPTLTVMREPLITATLLSIYSAHAGQRRPSARYSACTPRPTRRGGRPPRPPCGIARRAWRGSGTHGRSRSSRPCTALRRSRGSSARRPAAPAPDVRAA